MAKVTLYNADNGLSCVVDANIGLRAKSWLEELPRFLKEAVEPSALAGLGMGRLANFPSVIDGSKMGVKPLGEAYSTPSFSGVELFECVPNTQIVGIGDNATLAFGAAALTIGDITAAGYATAGAASGTDCVPQGGVPYPAFITSDAENYNLAATDGVLSAVINGVTHTAAVGTGAATTAEQVIAAIRLANWPCQVVGVINTGAITQVRLLALNPGRSSTMQAVTTAGTAGAVIWATETNAVRYGWGGPLNDVRHATASHGREVPGIKPQRRVLPGSVDVSTTLTAAGAVSMVDDRAGVLADALGTSVGTINYATGALTMTFVGNVANATNIVANYKSLWPINLHEEVRVPEGQNLDLAIRLK